MRNHLFSRCSLALGGVVVSLAVAANAAAPARADSACAGGLPSNGTVYYVSPTGSDSNSGTSPCAPWQSMNKADAAHLTPGDTVAFQGGATFPEPLSLQGEMGTSTEPIYYTSYGTGPATLAGGAWLQSVSYIDLTGLTIASASSAGVHSSGSGSGATNVTLRDDSITSSYDSWVGGYGVALLNSLDSGWTIVDDSILNTADSGVFDHAGGPVMIMNNTFINNGIGRHCGPPATYGVNPCHAIYAKGPSVAAIGNVITNPQSGGVSLRYQNDVVENNTITGGQKGIAFTSETATPGTTYISGNRLSGQSDTGILIAQGTEPLYESFVISGNTVSNPANYDLFVGSGPDSDTTQTVTLTGNVFQVGGAAGVQGYVNLAAPASYTARTYSDRSDNFAGARSTRAFYVDGTARTRAAYSSWSTTSSQQPTAGHGKSRPAHATQSQKKTTHSRTGSTSSSGRHHGRSRAAKGRA